DKLLETQKLYEKVAIIFVMFMVQIIPNPLPRHLRQYYLAFISYLIVPTTPACHSVVFINITRVNIIHHGVLSATVLAIKITHIPPAFSPHPGANTHVEYTK